MNADQEAILGAISAVPQAAKGVWSAAPTSPPTRRVDTIPGAIGALFSLFEAKKGTWATKLFSSGVSRAGAARKIREAELYHRHFPFSSLQGRFEFGEGPSGKRNFDIKIDKF